jgi:NADH-quinone oxidoreductase subunit K
MILADHATVYAVILFGIGLVGALTRRNLLVVFISVEIMLNAVNLNIVAASRRAVTGAGAYGESVALFVILLAACEVAVGLGILLGLYRRYGRLDIEEIMEMKE